MKPLIDVSVVVLTVLMMTALGLDLTGRDFARVRRQPGLVLGGLVGPLLLLPPIALVLVWLLRPTPDVAAAVLLIAACPIGGIANTFSYLARASGALSITLTGLSCLLAAVTMPVLGRLFAGLLPDSLVLTVPVSTLLAQFAVLLIVPAGLGMWVRQRWAEWAIARQPLLRQLSFAGVALVLALIVLDDPGAFVGGLSTTVPLAAAFVVCSAAGGWVTGAMLSRQPEDRFTIAVGFGCRNLGVAMAVAVSMLGRVEFARFAYTYFLAELPLMLIAVAVFRRQRGVIVPAA